MHLSFLAQIVLLNKEGHAQRQTLLLQRAESFDAGAVPSTLSVARSGTLQFARRDSLQEEGGGSDVSEADRDAMEARDDLCGVCLENLFIATTLCYENNCMYRRSHPSQYL